jgi:hypothetical protein
VHDGVGGLRVEQPGERGLIREIGRDGEGARRRQAAPVGGDDEEAPLVQQRRQPSAEKAARTRDQDAQQVLSRS